MNILLAWLTGAVGGLISGIGFLTFVGVNPLTLGTAIVLGILVALMLFCSTHYMLADLDKFNDESSENAKAEESDIEFFKNSNLSGVPNVEEFKRSLLQARDKLNRIYTNAIHINNFDVKSKILMLKAEAHKVIDEIKKDPRDYRIARSWLNTYLDQVVELTAQFKENEANLTPKLIEDFSNTLDSAVSNTKDLQQALLHNDLNSFSVNLEVFKDQLKIEKR